MAHLHRVVFGLFAAGMLLLAGLGLSLPFVPDADTGFAPGSEAAVEILHVTQEAAAGMFALGLMAAWAARHPARSGAVHAALTAYFVLIAAIHWIDFARGERPLASGLVNSVPFAVLAALWRVRRPSAPPERT
jgi:hypothetical protein